MKLDNLIRECTSAWSDGDIKGVVKLHNCKDELLIDRTRNNSLANKFSRFYNQHTNLHELYEAYFDIFDNTLCYFYDFPHISNDLVISSWAVYQGQNDNFESDVLLYGTNYSNIHEGKVISSITYHSDHADTDNFKKPSNNSAVEYHLSKLNQQKYIKSKAPDEYLNKYAKKFMHLFEAEKWYLDNNISIDYIAEKLGISRVYLSQVLNLKINKRYHDLINEYRIKEALRIMDTMDKYSSNRIIDIALSVGYNSMPCFYRAFKKQTGTTPAVYYRAVFSTV